jgi:hypothetical protein
MYVHMQTVEFTYVAHMLRHMFHLVLRLDKFQPYVSMCCSEFLPPSLIYFRISHAEDSIYLISRLQALLLIFASRELYFS